MQYLCIEGVMGSGKSFMMRRLEDALKKPEYQHTLDVHFIPEPVERFQQFKDHEPLRLSYVDPHRYAAMVQSYIIDESFLYYEQALGEAEKRSNKKTVSIAISERSVYSPSVFVHSATERRLFSRFESDLLLSRWESAVDKSTFHPNMIIYLDVSPSFALANVKERGREGEENITCEHLKSLARAYEQYFASKTCRNVHVLRVNPEWGLEMLMKKVETCIVRLVSPVCSDTCRSVCHHRHSNKFQ